MNTEKLLKLIESHKVIIQPSKKTDLIPDYELYGLVRYWTLSQAICLISGLAPIDLDTLRELVCIDKNSLVYKVASSVPESEEASFIENYPSYAHYVMKNFPFEFVNLHRLTNIYELFSESLKNKELSVAKVIADPSRFSYRDKVELFTPSEIVDFALERGLNVDNNLHEVLRKRNKISDVDLPNKAIKDSVCMYGVYTARLIEYNQSLPLPLATVNATGPLWYESKFKKCEKEAYQKSNKTLLKSSIKPKSSIDESTISNSNEFLQKDISKSRDIKKNEFEHIRAYIIICKTNALQNSVKHLIDKSCANLSKRQRKQLEELIVQIANEPIELNYTKKVPKLSNKNLFRKHQCFAIIQLLRAIDGSISREQLLTHSCIRNYGYLEMKYQPSKRTWDYWVNEVENRHQVYQVDISELFIKI